MTAGSWGMDVLSAPAGVERPKMEWIDLRGCICRIERRELRGELGEAATGGLLPL